MCFRNTVEILTDFLEFVLTPTHPRTVAVSISCRPMRDVFCSWLESEYHLRKKVFGVFDSWKNGRLKRSNISFDVLKEFKLFSSNAYVCERKAPTTKIDDINNNGNGSHYFWFTSKEFVQYYCILLLYVLIKQKSNISHVLHRVIYWNTIGIHKWIR